MTTAADADVMRAQLAHLRDGRLAEAAGLADSNGNTNRPPQSGGEPEPPAIIVRPWPSPLAPAAHHGLIGELVEAIVPHTEADPAALLIQGLVAYGSLIGRCAHFTAEASRHFTNLFVCLVGDTARGRKGSSWSHILNRFRVCDPDWEANRIKSGLSSGEGLIFSVRDPITRVDRKGSVETPDPGEADKRLLVEEAEFCSILAVLKREGNTLSALVRQAWDGKKLSTLTKTPLSASDAHISIVGHITNLELNRNLENTETANGFANRFLWVCTRRSKLLPEGGNVQDVYWTEFDKKLRAAIDYGRQQGEMRRDEQARALWCAAYERLTEGRPGLLGAVTSRAEPQTMRLATIYALLDRSPVIGEVHLQAALAVWRYCDASAQYIFGDALGDPVADDILRELRARPDGMRQTEISDLFKRHLRSSELKRALGALLQLGMVQVDTRETVEGARPKSSERRGTFLKELRNKRKKRKKGLA